MSSPQAPPGPPSPQAGVFTDPPPQVLCSWQECLGGHRWRATLVVTLCQGCQTPVLAVKKENCPYCNEPTTKASIRSDYLPGGAGLAARCKGQICGGETMDIELIRTHWVEAQEKAVLFEEREAQAHQAIKA